MQHLHFLKLTGDMGTLSRAPGRGGETADYTFGCSVLYVLQGFFSNVVYMYTTLEKKNL